ncbi:MAG: 30S ribosomal protein S4 [Candidatus Omnitrophica bacterium]|nr:30S ribosomal protein S4 [Candidatus Omnitrophota bacterium]
MGDPKKSRRHYSRPLRPYESERIKDEKILMRKYGLRRKNEIWKAENVLKKIRKRAKDLIAVRNPEEKEKFIKKLIHKGFIPADNTTLDTILTLTVENILDRHLGSILLKRDLANTAIQARQFIVHGHITVGNHKVTSPAYIVSRDEENDIRYNVNSNLNNSFKLRVKKPDVTPKPHDKTRKSGGRRGRRV